MSMTTAERPDRSGAQDEAGQSPGAPGHGPDMSKVRPAVRGAILAYFVDQFDIYLPIVVIAPAVGYFQSATLSASTVSLLSSLVFAATLVGRPLGAAVFGHFADTVGRRRTTLVAVAGFGVITLATACLPGQSTIGLWSIGLLIGLRFLDGIFLGGEYTTAVPLAMEWSPREKRGLYASIITSSSPGAYAVIAAITLLLLGVMPSAGLHSAYVEWGWRIPFVVGALLAAVLFRYYRRNVHEPPDAVTGGETQGVPFLRLLRRYPKSLFQVFVLMTGTWLATNVEAAVTPVQLAAHVGLSSRHVTLTMLVIMAAAAASYPVFGLISQRIGRRPFYIGYGVCVLVIGTGAYLLLMTASGLGAAIGWGVLLSVFSIGTFGPIAAYLTERFAGPIRSTGYGVGYSLALIGPAFYEFYLHRLDNIVAAHLAPAILLALAGILIGVGGWLGPETRDVDMADDSTIPAMD